MTTQSETPAVGSESTPAAEPTNAADYFTQLAEEQFGVTDEEEQPAEGEQAQPDGTEEADDEPTLEEEVDDLPPIDAPVSWDAEAKAKFAELPRDAQEVIAKRESEREKFVQSKSQEAARAKQEAEQAAIQQVAAYEAQVAQQLSQYAEQIAPQRPNPALLQHDPQAFYAMQADYEAKVAQQQQLQQQSQQYAQQAQLRAQQIAQAEAAEQHRIIVDSFPEYADPTTGPELQRKLTAVAKELGYPDELIGQARATDILAIRQAAEWKADAEKYRALQKTKMEKVRAAKGLPKVATPGVSQGTDQLRARTAQAALDTALTSKNRDVQGAAFYQYLERTKQI
jgi:uncharacterized protein YeaO (DUF488 family)